MKQTYSRKYCIEILLACKCNLAGMQKCKTDGNCSCKSGYTGNKCKQCINGFFKGANDNCLACNCKKSGSNGDGCKDGKCSCKPGYTGNKCDHSPSKYILYLYVLRQN